MGLRATMLFALVSVPLVACSLMLGDDFTGGGSNGATPDAQSDRDPAVDAAVSDAATDSSVTAIDGAGGVIFREDFEQGCGQWELDDVELSSVQGHTGMGCRMCTNVTSANSIAIEKNLSGPKAGETYTLDVWIRKGGNTPGPQKLYVSLESEINGGNPKEEFSSTFGTDWQKLTLTHTTVPQIEYLVVHLGGETSVMGECIDVDEVVVTKK